MTRPADKINKGTKAFLSGTTGEYGAVCWNVHVTGKAVEDPYVDAELRVQDCSRAIHLDFGGRVSDITEGEDSRVEKLDNLIQHLLWFREALIEAGQVKFSEEEITAFKIREEGFPQLDQLDELFGEDND